MPLDTTTIVKECKREEVIENSENIWSCSSLFLLLLVSTVYYPPSTVKRIISKIANFKTFQVQLLQTTKKIFDEVKICTQTKHLKSSF